MINHFYFMGTSNTAGGGFEFDSNHRHFNEGKPTSYLRGEFIKSIYSELPQTQEHYSFPGQFESLLRDNKNYSSVVNISKQGYGNERIYRKFFDLILDWDGFDKKHSLFIFEFSDLGRKEFYLNEYDNHIIMNWMGSDDNVCNLAKSYYYDDRDTRLNTTELISMFREYRKLFIDNDEQIKIMNRNLVMFISYLLENDINFLISDMPGVIHPTYMDFFNNIHDKFIKFKFNNKSYPGNLMGLVSESKLTIQHETSNGYVDYHPSLFANKLISKMIYNELLDRDVITGEYYTISNEINFKENLKNKIM